MPRLPWLFPLSAIGWLVLVAATASWPRLALTSDLPAFPTDLAQTAVVALLAATLIGGGALALPAAQPVRVCPEQPDPQASPPQPTPAADTD